MANNLVTDEEYLATVGRLMHNAAFTDSLAFTAFRILSGCDVAIARAIYFNTESLQMRKKMLSRIVAIKGNESDRVLIDELFKAVQKSNNQRQRVSHSLLMHVKGDPDELRVLLPKSGKKEPVTTQSMQSIMRESLQAFDEGLEAFRKLCEIRGIPPKVDLL